MIEKAKLIEYLNIQVVLVLDLFPNIVHLGQKLLVLTLHSHAGGEPASAQLGIESLSLAHEAYVNLDFSAPLIDRVIQRFEHCGELGQIFEVFILFRQCLQPIIAFFCGIVDRIDLCGASVKFVLHTDVFLLRFVFLEDKCLQLEQGLCDLTDLILLLLEK